MLLDGAPLRVQNLSQAQTKLGITAGGVPPTRLISTTAPLTGGGDLSANRTLSIPKATAVIDGYLAAADFAAFSAKESVLSFTAPLSRAGDTISIPAATGAVDGYLTAVSFAAFTAKVSATRAINTTAPLTGGGDLSSDRTIAIPASTNVVDGYLTSADHTTFAAKESALTFSAPLSRSANTISIPVATSLANGYLSSTDWSTFNSKVGTARSIATTSPLTGGGDLSADRTIAGDFTISWTWTANGIAATPTDRIILSNTTAATNGTQQYSGALHFIGQGFDTTANASKSCDCRIYMQPVQAAGNPGRNLLMEFAVGGSAFTTPYTFGSSAFTTTASIASAAITSTGNIQAGTSSIIGFSAKSRFICASDGVMKVTNNAGSTSSTFEALSFISGNPSGGTAAAWKFGSLVTAAVTADTTRYIQLDVAGTLYKLIIST